MAPLAALELGLIFKEKGLKLIENEINESKKSDNNEGNIFKLQRKKSDKKLNIDENDEIEEIFRIAEKYLTRATNNYSKYLNETMIHMRSYNALVIIQENRKRRSKVAKDKMLNRESSHASISSLLLI